MIDSSQTDWYKDAVIYQLHIKAFFDANNDGIGDFALVPDKLFLRAVGVAKEQEGYGASLDFTCEMIRRGTPQLAGIGDGLGFGGYGPDNSVPLPPLPGQTTPRNDFDTLPDLQPPIQVPVGSAADNAFSLPAQRNITQDGTCELGKLGGTSSDAGRLMLRFVPSDRLDINLAVDMMNSIDDPNVDTQISRISNQTDNDYDIGVVWPSYGIRYTTDNRFVTGDPYTNYATFSDVVNGQNYPREARMDSGGVSLVVTYDVSDRMSAKFILAARVEMHDGLDVHVVVEAVIGQAVLADLPAADVQVQMLADAVVADVRAGRVVGDGVVGVQIGDVLPHALVDVVAVLALGRRHEDLDAVVKAEQALRAIAVADQRVEGAQDTQALRRLRKAGARIAVGEGEGRRDPAHRQGEHQGRQDQGAVQAFREARDRQRADHRWRRDRDRLQERGAQHPEYRRAADPGHQRLRHHAPRQARAHQGRPRCAGGALQMSKAAKTISDPRLYDVILSPVITEKATTASEHNKVVFKVAGTATKPQIEKRSRNCST